MTRGDDFGRPREGGISQVLTEAVRAAVYSGSCANCGRERDDLFMHAYDGELYCVDVFRCEARLEIQARREGH